MTRRPLVPLLVACIVVALSGCVSLPTPPPPPAPTSAPAPSASPSTGTPTPDTATPSSQAPAPDATVVDCAVDASPLVSDEGATVVGPCDRVSVTTSGVRIEQAAAVLVSSGTGITIAAADELVINGSDIAVDAGTLGAVIVNGSDAVLVADAITLSLSVNGVGNDVRWTSGVAQSAASENGVDNVLAGP